MREWELTQGQVISPTPCEAEAGLDHFPMIHDSEDNHNGDEDSGGSQPIDRTDNNDQEVPAAGNDQEVPIAGNDQDVPVASDDQNVPAASNDQDVPVASNDQGVPATSNDQDVSITGNDYQDTVPRESSDDQEHCYPRRSHRPP